jgi:hypothetical protein
MVFCPGYGCCGSEESGSEMCELCRGCLYCAEDAAYATCSTRWTHLAIRLSGSTTSPVRTENHRQWHAVCSPDDGRKDARNMLRNNWLPINHYLLRLVGLSFIRLKRNVSEALNPPCMRQLSFPILLLRMSVTSWWQKLAKAGSSYEQKQTMTVKHGTGKCSTDVRYFFLEVFPLNKVSYTWRGDFFFKYFTHSVLSRWRINELASVAVY